MKTMSLLIEAWREEAKLFRRDGKESAAIRLERMADRMERFIGLYGKGKDQK